MGCYLTNLQAAMVVSAELKLPQDCRFESPLREFLFGIDFLKAVLLFFLGRD